jgi:nucleoside-diphosphate-sugar epimerase
MRITVLGSGWYGTPLSNALKDLGHSVLVTSRDPQKKQEFEKKGIPTHLLEAPEIPSSEILQTDILILNTPPSAGGHTWFKDWPKTQAWVIFISSTSGKQLADEEWIQSTFKNWSILRFGGLLGEQRHPGRILSGKKDLPGRLWPVNLLHLDDAVGFTLKIIEAGIKGEIIEVVSDEHRTREEFYKEYCKQNQLPLPHFDQNDQSEKNLIQNQRAKEIYEFKWPLKL